MSGRSSPRRPRASRSIKFGQSSLTSRTGRLGDRRVAPPGYETGRPTRRRGITVAYRQRAVQRCLRDPSRRPAEPSRLRTRGGIAGARPPCRRRVGPELRWGNVDQVVGVVGSHPAAVRVVGLAHAHCGQADRPKARSRHGADFELSPVTPCRSGVPRRYTGDEITMDGWQPGRLLRYGRRKHARTGSVASQARRSVGDTRAAGRVLPHVRRAAGARPVRGRDRTRSRRGVRRGVPRSPGRGTRPADQPAPGEGPRARTRRAARSRAPPRSRPATAQGFIERNAKLAWLRDDPRVTDLARGAARRPLPVQRKRRQRLQLVHLLALRLFPQQRPARTQAQDRVLPRRARRRQRRAPRDARAPTISARTATRSTTKPASRDAGRPGDASSASPRTSCRAGRSRRNPATSSCSTTRRCTPTSTAGRTGECSRSSSLQ